jgi:hypothetical protein
VVGHACNHSGDRKITQRLAKRIGGVAEVVSPKFKPQYLKKGQESRN